MLIPVYNETLTHSSHLMAYDEFIICPLNSSANPISRVDSLKNKIRESGRPLIQPQQWHGPRTPDERKASKKDV